MERTNLTTPMPFLHWVPHRSRSALRRSETSGEVMIHVVDDDKRPRERWSWLIHGATVKIRIVLAHKLEDACLIEGAKFHSITPMVNTELAALGTKMSLSWMRWT